MANRKQRHAVGQATVDILKEGKYFYTVSETSATIDTQKVDISRDLQQSIKQTCSYSENCVLPKLLPKTKHKTEFRVHNITSLAAAKQLYDEYKTSSVAVLNFASANNPGGGFLRGSVAQEESLAYSSGLYATIKNDHMYAHHRPMKGGIYTDWVIVSPVVPVFRRDDFSLMETPWLCSFITCPAINATAAKKILSEKQLQNAMRKRMRRMLQVTAAHHNGPLVLGAWGCGVFGNDCTMVARLFRELLCSDQEFIDRWPVVYFAVLDSTKDEKFIRPFEIEISECV
eukprot:scaffold4035_cov52-Attheya_sp.AAC.4